MLLRVAIVALSLVAPAWAGDPPSPVCAAGEFAATSGCVPSPSDIREAQQAFKEGLRFEGQGQLDRAFGAFELAQKLVPSHSEYASAHEVVRRGW